MQESKCKRSDFKKSVVVVVAELYTNQLTVNYITNDT